MPVMIPKKGKTQKIKESILGPAKNKGKKKGNLKKSQKTPDKTNTVYE
jgi:hypothetical protein